MKLVALLAVVAVALSTKIYAQSVLQADVDVEARNIASRANLNVGNTTAQDRQLYSIYTTRLPIGYNTWQIEEFSFFGNVTTYISAVRVLEQGVSQNGYPYIYSGGPGYNYAIVRIQSDRSRGWNYTLSVWGR